jgi:hypothetical protein
VIKNGDGAEFVNWLSVSLRRVMHEDFDELFDDILVSSGIRLSNFVYDPSAPYFIDEYLKLQQASLLLELLGFSKCTENLGRFGIYLHKTNGFFLKKSQMI